MTSISDPSVGTWTRCLSDLGLTAPEELGIALLARWDEPHRAYHTREHLAACLDHWRSVRAHIDEPALVGLALCYHDAIYDPKRTDNESASAELASTDLDRCGADARIRDVVASLVLATAHQAEPAPGDPAALVDIDLAILAAAPERYAAYVTNVRREYAHVSEAGWRFGRAKILQHLPDRPRLYTSGLFPTWEARARRNLTDELHALTR